MDFVLNQPPGTVRVTDLRENIDTLMLNPLPSNDPNEPLNWSLPRKVVNFGLVCFYVLGNFVLLDIGTVIWAPLNEELGIPFSGLNQSFGANTAALAVGGVLVVPFAITYGRRPVYLVSVATQLMCAIWQARMQSFGELIATSVLSGLGGAAAETLVQMTVSDLFFLHQRATANGVYLVVSSVGAWLSLIPAGFCADSMGWRWIWWWTAIILGIGLAAFILCYQETKHTITMQSQPSTVTNDTHTAVFPDDSTKDVCLPNLESTKTMASGAEDVCYQAQTATPLQPFRTKSSRKTLFLVIKTENMSLHQFYRPFEVLITFPAAAYTALIYGSILAWFSIIATLESTYLPQPPYNFSSTGLGLFNIPPMIGSICGSLYGGPLSDWLILKLARLNGGIYEPEMRLYIALPGILACPAGILLFGLSLAEGRPWILLAVGSGLFVFSFSAMGDISLTYLNDCYRDIIGDAMVGVAFIRNAFATLIVLILDRWVESTGLKNMFVAVSIIGTLVMLLTFPCMIWGKKFRVMTAARYRQLAIV